jgi:hypothetical protein
MLHGLLCLPLLLCAQDEYSQRITVLRQRAGELKVWAAWQDLPQALVDPMFRWAVASSVYAYIAVIPAAAAVQVQFCCTCIVPAVVRDAAVVLALVDPMFRCGSAAPVQLLLCCHTTLSGTLQ